MTKTVPAALQTALDSGALALATCVKITTKTGTVYGFTDWETDLVVSAVTYKSIGGYTASSVRTSGAMNVDNVDLVGYFEANGLTLANIRAGALDNAAVEKFKVNPRSIADGIIKLRAGTIGRVMSGDLDYQLEVRGMMQGLQQPVGKVVSAVCRAALFDAECQVPQTPPDWTASTVVTAVTDRDAGTGSWVKPTTPNGYYYKCTTGGTTNDTEGEPTWNTTPGGSTVEADGVVWETVVAFEASASVTTATDRANFRASGLTVFDDQWFRHGQVTFTSGNNNGVSREIKNYTKTGSIIETFLPFPFDVAVTDTFTITAGCDKSLTHCRDKFDNIHNRRAEDFVPGLDKANETPKVR